MKEELKINDFYFFQNEVCRQVQILLLVFDEAGAYDVADNHRPIFFAGNSQSLRKTRFRIRGEIIAADNRSVGLHWETMVEKSALHHPNLVYHSI